MCPHGVIGSSIDRNAAPIYYYTIHYRDTHFSSMPSIPLGQCRILQADGTRWNPMEPDGTRWNPMEPGGPFNCFQFPSLLLCVLSFDDYHHWMNFPEFSTTRHSPSGQGEGGGRRGVTTTKTHTHTHTHTRRRRRRRRSERERKDFCNSNRSIPSELFV